VTFVMGTWSHSAVLLRFFSGLMPQNELVSFFALALRNCVFYSSLFGSVFVAFVAHLFAFLLELSGFVGFLFRVWL